jgi:Domain of unknown function (DUF4345)
MLVTERLLWWFLVISGLFHVALGLFQLLDPGTFFEEVGGYGAENTHYVGDVGAFTLTAGIVLLLAARHPAWRVPVLTLTAIWYGLHAINHAFDVGEARTEARGWLDTGLIALGALVSAYLAWGASRLHNRGWGSPG